ncbi:hypothetical protein Tco_1477810 [Tanacetum coccineum]
MACSLSNTDSKVEALVQKLIDEDKGRQNAILNLALQFENSCKAKDDLRKAYEKCNDISQERRALIDAFLKESSAKDYELNLSMYENAAKLEKQMDSKLAWLLEKYYYRSQESVGCSSSQADLYLTEKELHQLYLDEEALRETLEEKAMDEKAREEKIRQKQDDDDEFFMEFGVVRYDSEYESSDYNPPTPGKPQMPLISSYPIVEEPAEEHDIVEELAEGGLTENELHQLALDEEALRKVLEEEAQAEKE